VLVVTFILLFEVTCFFLNILLMTFYRKAQYP
jgi:hypothetical protein